MARACASEDKRSGADTDPEKIEPVIKFPVPQNLKQLRRFMGMASWYRKFLKDFATIAEPLTALTKKKSAIRVGRRAARSL